MNNEVLDSVETINYVYGDKKTINNCTIEIVNSCVFKCEHCYMPEKGNHFMDFDIYKKILSQLDKMGCLWILITGGEPLLHPNFKDFYVYAKEKGFLVSVNTNGYMISDEIVDLFVKYNPYAIEISLYGYNDKTYEEFTHVKNSFEIVDKNIRKLLKNNINLNLKSVLVKKNNDYFDKLINYANKFDCSFRYDYVIFPKIDGSSQKTNPELLNSDSIICTLKNDNNSYLAFKERYDNIKLSKNNKIFQCNAGEESLYIDSYGNINMCIAVTNDNYNIGNITIKNAIKAFKHQKKLCFSKCAKCFKCYKKNICRYCPGRFKLETGSYEIPPEWYCETADAIIYNFCMDGTLYNFAHKINEEILEKIFIILKENYKELYDVKDADYLVWKNNILNSTDINTYVIQDENEIIGYIQYVLKDDSVCLSEIQINEKFQKDKKTFKKLMKDFVVLTKIKDSTVVYLFINPKNKHSKEVFTSVGFKNTSGNRYEILGKKLIDRYVG